MDKLAALAVPTVLFASACAPEDWQTPARVPTAPIQRTPSADAVGWPDVPEAAPVLAPSASQAQARWLLPTNNPWAPYQKSTLLAALDASERVAELPNVEQLAVVHEAREAARNVAAAGLPARTMWVVDLRGAGSVAFGATLSQETGDPVSPVLTFHNWPASDELVPAEETLAALVTMKPLLPVGSDSGSPVFLLDAWRLAYEYDRPDDETTDNRYMLTPADLPDPATLRRQGIDQVIYVVESLETSDSEQDDLHETFLAYQDAQIPILLVDLASLRTVEPALVEGWEARHCRHLYVLHDRHTVVEDHSFYFRARGGFGGPNVIYSGAYGFRGVHGGHGGG